MCRPLTALEADLSARSQPTPCAPMVECQRYRDALLWMWGADHCAPGETLLRAALAEMPLGGAITPPGLEDFHRLARLLRAMPWARAGFVPLARMSDEWGLVARVLCAQLGLSLPEPGEAT